MINKSNIYGSIKNKLNYRILWLLTRSSKFRKWIFAFADRHVVFPFPPFVFAGDFDIVGAF